MRGPALRRIAVGGLLAGATLGVASLAPVGSGGMAGAAGPAARYDCALNVNAGDFAGVEATASAIGWAGNQHGVVTCLGGTFMVQERNFTNFGFGLYDGGATTWRDVDGYLPAQVTTFHRLGGSVSITEFADRVVLQAEPFVAVYCRVTVSNPTGQPTAADPQPSPGLVPLNDAPNTVPPHSTVTHDYAIAVDRFGNSYAWPADQVLQQAGGFEQHFTDMRQFWDGQLATIAQVKVPDAALQDAYRAGYIETEIARSGDALDTGVNGYMFEYSHDVVGILTTLFTQGAFEDAHALLLEVRNVVGGGAVAGGQYVDGLWTYSLPWAAYLLKTGDVAFVRDNFTTEGPAGASQPSLADAAHQIAADRTGPGGTMEATDDIDTQGYWTVDDEEALLGLAAYGYLAERVGDSAEASWAHQQYSSLLAATDAALANTIGHDHLDYLPCSLFKPNTADRCGNPEDANWASTLSNWVWEGSLLGAKAPGPLSSLIDSTYAYGFGRLRGRLPPNTFGGYPGDYYSNGYNANYGTAGLVGGPAYRDQGILSYEFMIDHSQSGPNSWWESSSAPTTRGPWVGAHPTSGQGSSPHAWGLAGDDKVLLDSLAAQDADGSLIVGRGVPDSWLGPAPIGVDNFPTTDGARLGVRISRHGSSVSLALRGQRPSGPVRFELPAFVGNVASTSTGSVDERAGIVTLRPGTGTVTVTLRHPPS